LVLPNRTRLLLDLNTIVEISLPQEEVAETTVMLVQGRLLVETSTAPITIRQELATVTQQANSSMGVELNPETGQVQVDCLSGTCLVQSPKTEVSAQLETGQGVVVNADGQVTLVSSARYDLYRALAEAISSVITPTPMPTSTATAVLTPTLPLSATPTVLDLRFIDNRLEIGRSVNDNPIEVVQLSDGGLPVLFVGGIHAGYAPNSVALVEEIISHFRANPEEIPANVALYVVSNLNPDSPNAPGQIDGRLNANGVDLNRNWDCRWQQNSTILGEFVPGSGGAAPLSEPETQALNAFIQTIEPAAVVFWGAGGRSTGLASPGVCEEYSLVSAPLAQVYGRAADHNFVDKPIVEADPTLNGDVTNWLDKEGIPAVFILLSRFQAYNWEQELAGIQALLNAVATPGAALSAPLTEASCQITPAGQWAGNYESYRSRLGCAQNDATSPNSAYQNYANGMMVWRQDKQQVYVLYNDGDLSIHDVNDSSLADYSQSEMFKGAFGYLWNTNTAVSNQIGQPQAPEQEATEFTIQDFDKGVIFYFADNGAQTYIILEQENSWLLP